MRQSVVKLLCQDASRVKGQLMEGVEQEMPIAGTVWQQEPCVTGCWNALCGGNVMLALSASVFMLVCKNWSSANVLFFAVVMFSNVTGTFHIVTSEIVNLAVQINNEKQEKTWILANRCHGYHTGMATDESVTLCAFREYLEQLECNYPISLLGRKYPIVGNVIIRCRSVKPTLLLRSYCYCFPSFCLFCPPTGKQATHFGCVMGTSRTKSSGISNNSGSFPLACSRRGRTSKRPFGAFHPSCMQI